MATVWVKRTDVLARYIAIRSVDLETVTVDELITRWMAVEKPEGTTSPSLVSLKLVECGRRTPKAEEEAVAVPLDPRETLAATGVEAGSSLLAVIAPPPGAVGRKPPHGRSCFC